MRSEAAIEPVSNAAGADGTSGGARALHGIRAGLASWLEARAMFVMAVAAVLIASLLSIPLHVGQDSWLALVAGRSVAAHGIPQHDYFARLTYGVHWVDQQWLAQWLMYEVQRVGGFQLLTVLYVLVTTAAFAGAIAAARALVAQDLHVLRATVPGAFFYLVTALSIRTQGLVYPLFVATVWLLAAEVRAPVRRRRVYLVFPMLVLWANLHGSATLGAGLAGLYGLLLLIAGVGNRGVRGLADARAWAFVVISPLTLLATPYGLGMIHYYRVTLLNSQFSRMVTEWRPAASIPLLAVPLFLMIAVTTVAIGLTLWRARPRAYRVPTTPVRPPLFDVLTLGVLAVGAAMAIRNVTWFGLALIMLLPGIVTRLNTGRPAPLRRTRLNRRLASVAALLGIVLTVVVLARPAAWFTSTYPRKAIPTLRALIARYPHAGILADVRYADWLVWEDPRLFSGRIAYDTSFELLTGSQLTAIADLAGKSSNARRLADSYRIWMLYPGNRSDDKKLLRRPGVRLVSRSHKLIIALRATTAAA